MAEKQDFEELVAACSQEACQDSWDNANEFDDWDPPEGTFPVTLSKASFFTYKDKQDNDAIGCNVPMTIMEGTDPETGEDLAERTMRIGIFAGKTAKGKANPSLGFGKALAALLAGGVQIPNMQEGFRLINNKCEGTTMNLVVKKRGEFTNYSIVG